MTPATPADERLDRVLRAAAADHADRPAVVDGELRLTHGELADHVTALAAALAVQGVVPGAVVSFHLPNGLDAIATYRACWQAGAVAAPLHPAATEAEIASILLRLRPTVHLSGRAATAALLDGTLDTVLPSTPRLLDPSLAVLLATSGSTGPPKLVAHRHASLAAKALQMRAVHGLDETDVVLMPAPMAHMSGLLNGVLVPGVTGMACVTMARWRPDAGLDLIEHEHVSFMVGPPTFFVAMIDDAGFAPARVASLRLVSCGGADVTPAFVRRATEQLGAVVKRTYGSTEAPTIATSATDDDAEVAATTDGRLLAGVDARIVDPVTGEVLTEGPGELWVRGPELPVGYLVDEGTIEPATTADGFYRTGDLATLVDGRLTITGRLKDLIIRGGENVSAAEVEEVLEAHPAVQQAAVVGMPDDLLGEIVEAFVVADDSFDLAMCRAWFAAQGIARYKTPEHVEVVPDLPVLASGKVDKAALRNR